MNIFNMQKTMENNVNNLYIHIQQVLEFITDKNN